MRTCTKLSPEHIPFVPFSVCMCNQCENYNNRIHQKTTKGRFLQMLMHTQMNSEQIKVNGRRQTLSTDSVTI